MKKPVIHVMSTFPRGEVDSGRTTYCGSMAGFIVEYYDYKQLRFWSFSTAERLVYDQWVAIMSLCPDCRQLSACCQFRNWS